MRGGNRTRLVSRPGAKPPRPPRDLSPLEVRIWDELRVAVTKIGTYQPSDLTFFRLTVRTVAEAEGPGNMPPTARARVLQAAGSMLSSFGLSPLARERVHGEPPESEEEAARRARIRGLLE